MEDVFGVANVRLLLLINIVIFGSFFFPGYSAHRFFGLYLVVGSGTSLLQVHYSFDLPCLWFPVVEKSKQEWNKCSKDDDVMLRCVRCILRSRN